MFLFRDYLKSGSGLFNRFYVGRVEGVDDPIIRVDKPRGDESMEDCFQVLLKKTLLWLWFSAV